LPQSTRLRQKVKLMSIFNIACDHIGMRSSTCTMLRTLYTEPHRFYHNLGHIEDLLSIAESEGKYSHEMVTTILFHDAVYYPQSKFNEELSAALYRYDFRSAADLRVVEAIIASKNHLDPVNEDLAPWVLNFLDYDLAGLAGNKFEENSAKIYLEFHKVVTFDKFVEGRAAFFMKLLSYKSLYWKHPQWDQPARDNIYKELRLMENVEAYRAKLEADSITVMLKEAGK